MRRARLVLGACLLVVGVPAAGPGHAASEPARGGDGAASPLASDPEPVPAPGPVPMPRVRPAKPGPVPIPRVQPTEPGPVPMPEARPSEQGSTFRLEPDGDAGPSRLLEQLERRSSPRGR